MNLVWLLYHVWVSYTKVSQTTGLFSSPGAVVLQGEGVDVLEDVDMVRQAGTCHWPVVALHLQHVIEKTSFRGRKDSLCQKHRPTKRLLKLYGQTKMVAQAGVLIWCLRGHEILKISWSASCTGGSATWKDWKGERMSTSRLYSVTRPGRCWYKLGKI